MEPTPKQKRTTPCDQDISLPAPSLDLSCELLPSDSKCIKGLLARLNKNLKATGTDHEIRHIEQLGLDKNGEPKSLYADIHHCRLGEKPIILKMVGGMLGGSSDELNLDEAALNSRCCNMPEKLGVIHDSEGQLFCIALSYIDGVRSDVAIKSGQITREEALEGYVNLLSEINNGGFKLWDVGPENIFVLHDGSFVLVDAGSIARSETPVNEDDLRTLAETILSGLEINT